MWTNRFPQNLPQLDMSAPSRAIGQWCTFETGALVGRTVRFEVEEMQKAQGGRKYVLPARVTVVVTPIS